MLGLSEVLLVLFLLEDHHYLLHEVTQNQFKTAFYKSPLNNFKQDHQLTGWSAILSSC